MIQHTQLTKLAFIEAVRNTDVFKKIGNPVFQNMVVKSTKIDEFYENYRQGVRYGIQYLKQKPSLLSREVNIIEEIINYK
jgi:hypothetical protein